ncbi:ABC transporter ATP-binding protein [Desulfogranum japonicum]|uniref:ABC transporter ATP-binding protein n=1 Tax=Desulfogranum japonicum TaxID=231447 RepID=UPI0004052DC0|nr:ABC transporter ATP-binding protein [Desulfogranum japonicum]
MARLTLTNLSKRYGKHIALDSINLEAAPGEFIALLGPSGCGKTTTLRLIAGFEQPSAGEIHYGDRCLATAEETIPPEQRNMAVVFQSYALWPHLSVAENVGYPLRTRYIKGKHYREKVQEALATVEMTEFSQRSPADLSGGQRQRVALARCLVMTPSVVLLDEPLANLDRHLRATMEKYFSRFHKKTKATMLYVTHDQGEAMALADRIAVMGNGRMEQTASPEQLYREPANTSVAKFIGEGVCLQAEEIRQGMAWISGSAFTFRQGRDCSTESLQFCIRPENVTLGDGHVHAEIARCQFRGERYFLDMVLEDGQGLCAYSNLRHTPGERVRCSIDDGWRIPTATTFDQQSMKASYM